MSDKTQTVSTSTLLHTGAGQLMAVAISSSSGSPIATFYDNTSGSGTKIFEAYVPTGYPLLHKFGEILAPFFSNGLYLSLAAGMTATVWWREF
jgi:hypothetical protein